MIQRTQRRLSRIEDFFSRLLTKGKVSKNIFVGDLPPTTSKDWSDFVLVDIGQQKDRNAYSIGYANIYLYARPRVVLLERTLLCLTKWRKLSVTP